MKYQEYKDKRQEEFNALPIFWAFSREQFKAAMEMRGLTENDTDKVYAFFGGGYYLKDDADIIADYMLRSSERQDELHQMMVKDPHFAEEAFYFEMANHEYVYNYEGDWNVCSCFGSCEYEEGADGAYYLRDMGYDDNVVLAYKRARSRIIRDTDY